MRKIEWPPGTATTTKERASAIAWATYRRGSKVWVGKNVTAEITDYLREHGFEMGNHARTIMNKLATEGYAYTRLAEGKRRIIEFGFMPDVIIKGHDLPVKEEAAIHVIETQHDLYPGSGFVPPPLPAAPEAPLYRIDELEKLLKNWADKDHETFAGWIDAAIESLRQNT